MGTVVSIPVIVSLQLLVAYAARIAFVKHAFDPGAGPSLPGEIFGRFGQYALSYFSWDTAYSLGWAVIYLTLFLSVVLRASLESAWGDADRRALEGLKKDAEGLLVASYALLVFWYPIAVLITCPDRQTRQRVAPARKEQTPSELTSLLRALPSSKQRDAALRSIENAEAPLETGGEGLVETLTTLPSSLGVVAAVSQAVLVCTAALLSVIGLSAAKSFSRQSAAAVLFGELTWGFFSGFLTFCCSASVGVALRRLRVSPRAGYTHDIGTYVVIEDCIRQLVFVLDNTKDNALTDGYKKSLEMTDEFVSPALPNKEAGDVDKSVKLMYEQANDVALLITKKLSSSNKPITDNQRQNATRYVTVPYLRQRGIVYVAPSEEEGGAAPNFKAPFLELQLGTIVPTLVVCIISVAVPSPTFALGGLLGFMFIINHDIAPVRVLRALVAVAFVAATVRAVVQLAD